jgi:hypothetical protein
MLPAYNIRTRKIENAPANTGAYWHEARHSWQFKTFPFLEVFFRFDFWAAIIAVGAITNNQLVVWSLCFFWCVLEADAHAFSWLKCHFLKTQMP